MRRVWVDSDFSEGSTSQPSKRSARTANLKSRPHRAANRIVSRHHVESDRSHVLVIIELTQNRHLLPAPVPSHDIQTDKASSRTNDEERETRVGPGCRRKAQPLRLNRVILWAPGAACIVETLRNANGTESCLSHASGTRAATQRHLIFNTRGTVRRGPCVNCWTARAASIIEAFRQASSAETMFCHIIGASATTQ